MHFTHTTSHTTPHTHTLLLVCWWLQAAVRLEMLKLTPMLVEATRTTRDVSQQVGAHAQVPP
jgi:hypothetical protein